MGELVYGQLSRVTVPVRHQSEQDSRPRERANMQPPRKPLGDGYADQEGGKALNPKSCRTSRDWGTSWDHRTFWAREPGAPNAPLTLGKSTMDAIGATATSS